MKSIDFGELELSKPHEMKVEEMVDAGHATSEGLTIALQKVIDQQYEQFDSQRRKADE